MDSGALCSYKLFGASEAVIDTAGGRVKALTFAVIIATGILLAICGKVRGEEGAQSVEWQINIVARTLLAEARSEGTNGMYAVACVMQQRQIERGISPADVCLQRLQFSCWNKATAKDKQVKPLKASWQASYAMLLAKAIVSGQQLQRGFVGGANHYHTIDVSPSWSRGVRPVTQVGRHLFFKL
jgi:spore germination cell wall hydrolase CwlJ-like protein